jgi:hypothetical protein
MNDPRSFVFLALTFAVAGVAPVQASTPDPLPAQLKHCASLTDAGIRLACYDALAGSSASNTVTAQAPAGSSSAPSSGVTATAGAAATAGTAAKAGAAATTGAPAAVGVAAPPAAREFEFGVHNGPLEAKLITPQREKRLLAVVSGISNRPRGELVVTLDNGQVWVQLEATRYPLKTGDHVEIDVGALGSYVLWCPANRRATKVTRIS